MSISSVLLLSFILFIGIKEVLLIWDWYKIKSRNVEIFYAKITDVFQRHDLSPIYQVKIKDSKYNHSFNLKTSIISSNLPRFLGSEFRVIVNENEMICMVYHPFFYFFSILIVFLLGIFSISFFNF